MIISLHVVTLSEHYIQIQIYTNHISSGDSLPQQIPTGSLSYQEELTPVISYSMQKSSRDNSSVTEGVEAPVRGRGEGWLPPPPLFSLHTQDLHVHNMAGLPWWSSG